ncbi:hypothetical protein P691DRAFT_812587, partial [Macrolepiota fuliginosa MF-IS2]
MNYENSAALDGGQWPMKSSVVGNEPREGIRSDYPSPEKEISNQQKVTQDSTFIVAHRAKSQSSLHRSCFSFLFM